MIYKTFASEVFEEESKKIAYTLATMPTKGLAFTKQALNVSMNNSFENQLKQEDILQQQAAATKDFKEGVDAFLEKRLPNFTGE